MTTCKVHNVKFYKLDPEGINCMALETSRKKLAISRSNATIQIWDISHTPYIERTIPNKSKASIEALCWYKNRLFSVGLSGQLIEYDLKTLTEKYAIPIIGGAGWCMDIRNEIIVIGTEQGYLNVYQVTDKSVEFVKILDKQEGRVLCLKISHDGKFIASGSVDTVRIWSVSLGHAIHKMNLSRLVNNAETLVWCILITKNFTIVTGDSRGFITFWDGETGSQIENYQSHSAAVLSICLSENGKTIYCAGVDPLIMSYERISMKDKTDKWVRSIHRKIHEHDVRNLAFCDDRLYSGGVDGYLACSYYPPKTLVKYPPLLQNPCVSLAHEAKYILMQYPKKVEVWNLGEEDGEESAQGPLKLKEQPKKLLEVQTKGGEGVLCSAVSNNGQMLFYSTVTRFRLFHFNYNEDISSQECLEGKPELILIDNLPEECSTCIRAQFTSDSKHLIFAPSAGGIVILKLSDRIVVSQILQTENYLQDTITFLNISWCGKLIVAADPQSNIVVWNLKNDKWNYYTSLPKYECPPTAMGIHPKTNNLVVAYVDHKITEYNLATRKFTDFCQALSTKISRQWLNKSFPVINITFDPRAKHIIALHDDSNICVIDKDKNLPSANAKIPKLDSSSNAVSNHAFHTIKRSKHLVYFGWLTDGEMVSVELSPLSLLEKLPSAFEKKKFGTK